ncbi:MAG: helix-turn-helix domain-containing protein [Pseudomonadota bacterium]|jgi:putative transcriptional regulator|nr:helix-turn-helix domain-containing protein [Pseudomonadota bacterium]|tara:strand:+ start:63265 stop:63561 length:297 start_codon:yes stop_codon:yes gene_type:complete
MSKLGNELIESLSEALAHAEGQKVRVRAHEIDVRPDSIQSARKRLGLSQDRFAQAFGVSASTLRKWEQGQRKPNGAAKTLLRIIEREPNAVLRALEPQ